ncbi:MAG: TlpA family protein disulfide reductase [Gemmatimonadaceae bacterium]
MNTLARRTSPPWNARRRMAVCLVFSGLALGLLGFGMSRDARLIPSPLVGLPAPVFALQVMAAADSLDRGDGSDGDIVRLAELRGSVVVVNFWASWCLACREEHRALSETAARYRGRGVRFLGVLYKDGPRDARAWIAEMGGQTYPTLLDPRARTAIDFGLYGVPETYFIDATGLVAAKHIGPVTAAVLSSRIDSLLAATSIRHE